MTTKSVRAFSLIELLVAIAIMATVMAIGIPNYLSARQRARDAKIKQEMTQLKNALRMFYNDYQRYPADSSGVRGLGIGGSSAVTGTGCGASANAACGSAGLNGCHFSVGGDTCAATTNVYMKRFPDWSTSNRFTNLRYYTNASGQNFILKYTLENAGDPEIAVSQSKCAASTSLTASTCTGKEYCLCED